MFQWISKNDTSAWEAYYDRFQQRNDRNEIDQFKTALKLCLPLCYQDVPKFWEIFPSCNGSDVIRFKLADVIITPNWVLDSKSCENLFELIPYVSYQTNEVVWVWNLAVNCAVHLMMFEHFVHVRLRMNNSTSDRSVQSNPISLVGVHEPTIIDLTGTDEPFTPCRPWLSITNPSIENATPTTEFPDTLPLKRKRSFVLTYKESFESEDTHKKAKKRKTKSPQKKANKILNSHISLY